MSLCGFDETHRMGFASAVSTAHRRMGEGAVVAACFFLGAMQAARQA